ncbi:MFS transporter [Alteribacillus iranensis]|uniref:Uncharacterized MFS-type transporter YbfB n=1 Tax=Alteribacillus iranensis TaxID=930128 RepID=A0A1I2F385_9BACI|nr:MFS transporter [Alteribacillus iranensis]SFE99168.1 Uncharacterised MFS-type transporter YbfB [Alteribacillus iranensis]
MQEKGKNIYIIMGILIVLIAIAFARLSYGMILPFMKEGLSISYQSAGALGTITSLGYLVTIMMAGYLSTKWGFKKTILFGMLLISIGFLNLSFAGTFWYSAVFMFLLGVGTAFVFTPLISLMIEWFPDKRGFVIGCVNSSGGIGLLFVGMLVPFLAEMYPETAWRLTWLIFCLMSALVTVLTVFYIKNPPAKKKEMQPPSSPPMTIYKNRNVIIVGIIYGISGLTMIVHSTFINSFMLDSGLNEQLAGQLISISGILYIFSSPIWGAISDRVGRKNALIYSMGLNAVSLVIPVMFSNTLGFAISLVIQGAVAVGILTLIQALSTEQVPSQDTPIAFSYVTFYYATGQLIGPMLSGFMIDFSGFKSAFLSLTISMALGFYLAFTLSSEKKVENKAIVNE